jgi:hypothetical protein
VLRRSESAEQYIPFTRDFIRGEIDRFEDRETSAQAAERWHLIADEDLQDFANFLVSQKIADLVLRRLREAKPSARLTALTQHVRTLQGDGFDEQKRRLFDNAQLSAAACASPPSRFFLAKGPYLSKLMYGHMIDYRDWHDIDIFVDWPTAVGLHAHLIQSGYWQILTIRHYSERIDNFTQLPEPVPNSEQRIIGEYVFDPSALCEFDVAIRLFCKDRDFLPSVFHSTDLQKAAGISARTCDLFLNFIIAAIEKYNDFQSGKGFSVRDILDFGFFRSQQDPVFWGEVERFALANACKGILASVMDVIDRAFPTEADSPWFDFKSAEADFDWITFETFFADKHSKLSKAAAHRMAQIPAKATPVPLNHTPRFQVFRVEMPTQQREGHISIQKTEANGQVSLIFEIADVPTRARDPLLLFLELFNRDAGTVDRAQIEVNHTDARQILGPTSDTTTTLSLSECTLAHVSDSHSRLTLVLPPEIDARDTCYVRVEALRRYLADYHAEQQPIVLSGTTGILAWQRADAQRAGA